MVTAALVGATGFVGSHMLTALLSDPSITSLTTLTRRAPTLPASSSSAKLNTHVSPTVTWSSALSSLSPAPSILLSGLGTTRAQAGSLAAQRAIDHDLNLSLARSAREAGTKVYVLISSASASSSSFLPYTRMKGELEEAVIALDFEKTVIVRPGLIMGDRSEKRTAEAVARAALGGLRSVLGEGVTGGLGQDADVIARAAVVAGVRCLDGKGPEGKVWEMGQREIIALGTTRPGEGKVSKEAA